MISPALEKYLMYQQALGQQTAESPIAAGASKGMEAARQSMQMNEEQRKRSQGLAVLSFLANKGVPEQGSGFGGALGAITQGLPAAGFSYDKSRQNEEAMNYKLMQDAASQQQHAADKQAEQARHLMDYENEQSKYNEAARHNQIMEDIKNHDIIEDKRLAEQEKELPEGSVLLARYKNQPSMMKYWEDRIEKSHGKAESANKGLRAVEGLKRIASRNKNIHKNMNAILLSGYSDDPAVWKQKLIELKVPEKQWSDYMEGLKYSAELWKASATSIPAKGLTVYAEKQLQRGVPSLGMPPEALKNILGNWEKDFKGARKTHKSVVDYARKGIGFRPSLGFDDEEETEQAVQGPEQSFDFSTMSPDEIRAEIAREEGAK